MLVIYDLTRLLWLPIQFQKCPLILWINFLWSAYLVYQEPFKNNLNTINVANN
jgi:hypothetical protein